MISRLRRSLAEWLCPEMALQARRRWYLGIKLSEASDWLGHDFPVVADVVRWASASERIHFRPLDDQSPMPECVPGKPWIHQIHDFREHLRSVYPVSPATAEPGEPE